MNCWLCQNKTSKYPIPWHKDVTICVNCKIDVDHAKKFTEELNK